MSLDKLISNLHNIDTVEDFFLSLVNEAGEKKVPEENRKQLSKGLDSKGKELKWKGPPRKGATSQSDPYTRKYVKFKSRKGANKNTDFVDLNIFGGFYKGIKWTRKSKNVFVLDSDSKTPFLEKNYGRNILGIPDKESFFRPIFTATERRIEQQIFRGV